MKLVILAGGYGTRISEETHLKPKPMIEIGGMPILWHIMKIYSSYGVNDFIVCCGYKGNMIKDYFARYFTQNSDFTLDIKNNKMEFHHKVSESWKITLVDTGLETMTGGRLKRVKHFLDDNTFCLTYGDDLKNVNISSLISFHKKNGKMATVTTVRHPEQFGILKLKNNRVISIREKPTNEDRWINGGYYVLEPEVLDYIKRNSTVFEKEPLEKLAKEGQLSAYKHDGFYRPFDTMQDKKFLENIWSSGKAYWKTWK